MSNSKACDTLQNFAGVAELADAPDSKSGGRKAVKVRFLYPAPNRPAVTVYTVEPQITDFRFISLHSFAHPTLQKALKIAIFASFCGYSRLML